MGIDGWQLREVDGEPCLVEFQWNRFDWRPKEKRHRWYVGAPTIKAESGKFLASDPAGREPFVLLTEKKGGHTQWVFEIVSRLRPDIAKNQSKGDRFEEGPSGFTFRVKVAEGPFKNWYLSAPLTPGELVERKGQGPASRRLRLERDVKKATVFMYVQDTYFVDHN